MTKNRQATSNKETRISRSSLRSVGRGATCAGEWWSDTSGDAPRSPRGPPAHGGLGPRAARSCAPCRPDPRHLRLRRHRRAHGGWSGGDHLGRHRSRFHGVGGSRRRRCAAERITAGAAGGVCPSRADRGCGPRARGSVRRPGVRRGAQRGRRRRCDRGGGRRRGVPDRRGHGTRRVRRRWRTSVECGPW